MDTKYFERRDRDDARHAEWRLLDAALAARTSGVGYRWRPLRAAIGRLMIRAGMRLAGERAPVHV